MRRRCKYIVRIRENSLFQGHICPSRPPFARHCTGQKTTAWTRIRDSKGRIQLTITSAHYAEEQQPSSPNGSEHPFALLSQLPVLCDGLTCPPSPSAPRPMHSGHPCSSPLLSVLQMVGAWRTPVACFDPSLDNLDQEEVQLEE